jgi:hypothetical protein
MMMVAIRNGRAVLTATSQPEHPPGGHVQQQGEVQFVLV